MRPSLKQILRGVPVALAVTFAVPVALPTVVEAQSVDQQRQRVEDIVDELERLEERARQLGEDYNEAIDTKAQLDVEITDAEARIAEQEAELDQLRASLADMALRSFVGGGSVPLGPLFEDSENLNDAVKRDELARVALSAGDVSTDEFDALVADLNDEKDELARKREQADQIACLDLQVGDRRSALSQHAKKFTGDPVAERARIHAALRRAGTAALRRRWGSAICGIAPWARRRGRAPSG